MGAMAADIVKSLQLTVVIANNKDTLISDDASNEVAGLGYITDMALMPPGTVKNRLMFAPVYIRVKIPVGRQGGGLLCLGMELAGI